MRKNHVSNTKKITGGIVSWTSLWFDENVDLDWWISINFDVWFVIFENR